MSLLVSGAPMSCLIYTNIDGINKLEGYNNRVLQILALDAKLSKKQRSIAWGIQGGSKAAAGCLLCCFRGGCLQGVMW